MGSQAQSVDVSTTLKPEKTGLPHEIWQSRWPYLYISPFYILFLIFGLFPVLFSIYLSFTSWQGLGPIEFIGLANYRLILSDVIFWQSMLNGVILFFLYVPAMLFMAMVLAVILNSRRIHGFAFFRALIFLPYITNMVAAGFTFRLLMATENGLFHLLLESIGLPPVPWLDNVWWARVSLAILVIWAWLGYNMIFYLAGLQTIPAELNEAARIDGANSVQAFFYITVPLLKPVILFTTVFSLIGSFNLFAEILALTQGGPVNSTITPLIYIYEQAFSYFHFGYAATVSYVYFFFILIATLLQLRVFRSE